MPSSRKLPTNIADYHSTARLLCELITLEEEKRRVKYLSPFAPAPTVGEQIDKVILIGKALSNMVIKKSEVDPQRITNLLLWHDAPETRYGDLGRDQRKYILINEDRARSDQFGAMDWAAEVVELIETFEAGGEDINIKLARDADALYVIYTIKDLLLQGYFINNPEDRLSKTLKRMSTEEGYLLGREMASKTPKQIDDALAGYSGITQRNGESLYMLLSIAWALLELSGQESLRDKKTVLLDTLIGGKTSAKPTTINPFIADTKAIYKILAAKKSALKLTTKSRRPGKPTVSLKTSSGKVLAQVLGRTNLYDWWNLLMDYSTIQPDGSLLEKPR